MNTIKKLTVLSLATAAASGLAASRATAQAAQGPRPNILIIMSDDHSYQTIGCYGYNLNETPNLDRIAQSGAFFRNSFVSNSLCGPARAVILTGKFSHMNGYYDNESGAKFDQSQTTFPKLLQAAGYQTAIIGKWHLGGKPQGFDYYSVLQDQNQQGHYYNPDFLEPDGLKERVPGYVTDITVDKTLSWLQNSRDKSKPFMLMCHFKAPHRNWMPAQDKMEMYEDKTFPLPDNFYDDYEGRVAAQMSLMRIDRNTWMYSDLKALSYLGVEEPKVLGQELSRMTAAQKATFLKTYARIDKELQDAHLTGTALGEWKYQRFMRDYCKVISSVDDNVGRLIDYLKANGLWENTIVIYTSDQGFFMGEHGWFDKRWIYEQSFRTPFMISYPNGFSPKMHGEQTALIQSIDYAPTILDYAGAPIPKDMQGESLRPLFEGKVDKVRDAVYYHFYEYPAYHAVKRHYGARTDRYKIAHFYYDIDRWELFDLQTDPEEMHNVYDDPAYKTVRQQMRKILADLQAKYKDPAPPAKDPANDGYKASKHQLNNY